MTNQAQQSADKPQPTRIKIVLPRKPKKESKA
jgi:hypothetical protein